MQHNRENITQRVEKRVSFFFLLQNHWFRSSEAAEAPFFK